MGAADLALRSRAIPYYANIWGYNRSEDSDNDISVATNLGDVTNLAPAIYGAGGTIAAINPVRFLLPQYGNIVAANLHLSFTIAPGETSARQLRLAIGTFGQYWVANTSYSEAYINASHQLITGRTTPFSIAPGETFNYDTIELTKALYAKDSPYFNPDGFVLLLCFDQAPSTGSGYYFVKCDVECTMEMGLA